MHVSTWRNARQFVVDVVGRGKAASPCVITEPWAGRAAASGRALINPANSQLAGTARAYFPRGGPVPPPPPPGLQASSSSWGGLDAGEQMLYPAQVVDGLTHMHAGPGLREALAAVPARGDGKRCAIGGVVLSAPFNLSDRFDVIAHTPTPFFPTGSDDVEGWRQSLMACYTSSVLAIAEGAPLGVEKEYSETSDGALQWRDDDSGPLIVASPLLGAGAAGAPVALAADVAVEALARLASLDVARPLTVRLLLSEPAALGAVEAALTAENRQRGRLFLE